MRIGAAECFQADQAHEVAYFMAFFLENTARDQACFDIPAHSEPRKKVGILKNEAALGARARNFLFVHKQLASSGKVETGDQSQQRRFPATARPDQRHEVTGGNRKRNAVEHEAARPWCVRHRKTFADFVNAKR